MRKKSIKNGFIQRWFQTQLQHAYSNTMASDTPSISTRVNYFYFQKGIDIKVFFASNGGKIVKIGRFDDSKELSSNDTREKLYVINEEEDFGQAINNIVTMEALR
jgi:hypothetical protein